MANSKYEYVRTFEQPDSLLPDTWIVVRIDGRGFHKLTTHYSFAKPNDPRGLALMNAAAAAVAREIPDVVLAYGASDEFSFAFWRGTVLFERRASKLVSTIVSTFTAHYIHAWPTHFPSIPLSPSALPTFDGRAVLYPSTRALRDYFAWRQVDCHINNLYNTAFWALVQKGGLGHVEAEKELSGTYSSDKNEILFSRFGINYNNEPELYRKGSVAYRDFQFEEKDIKTLTPTVKEYDDIPSSAELASKTATEKERKLKSKARVVVAHIDIIKDDFWDKRPWILSGKAGRLPRSYDAAAATQTE